MQKEEFYGNSNISPCQKYNLQKNPLNKETQNPSRYHNSIELISSSNMTSQNIIFQKSSCKK
jgi:hypothetical protein